MRDPDAVARIIAGLPEPPRSLRSTRYRGDDQAVSLSDLPKAEADAVRTLYAMLVELDGALVSQRASAFDDIDLDLLLRSARAIGRDPDRPDVVRDALHDVRGGALTSLVVQTQRARRQPSADAFRSLRILTADHTKVMRNAVLGLDDARRDQDRAPAPHTVERLVESLARTQSELVRVDITCRFRGNITDTCLELGALDRAVLNLLNNAVRHAAGDTVRVEVVPTRDGDLRLLIANEIAPSDAERLSERFGHSLASLFVDPFTTTGSGRGMKICVGFVAAAYGLGISSALHERLVGACLEAEQFVAWLHWPAIV